MPDLEESNPYPEDEPKLHEAWREGYHAGRTGAPVPEPGETRYDDTRAELAWIRGYRFAQEQSPES